MMFSGKICIQVLLTWKQELVKKPFFFTLNVYLHLKVDLHLSNFFARQILTHYLYFQV